MSERTGAVAGAVLSAAACTTVCAAIWFAVGGAVASAQTPKNPISTKPEGTAPTCTYTGSKTTGQPPTGSAACSPGTVPGTDPNLNLPKSAAQQFPFPGDTLGPSTSAPPAPQAPDAQTPASSGSAVQRFPFPGDATPDAGAGGTERTTPKPVPGGNAQPPLQDAGSSGSSSSSSSSSGQADPGYSSSGAGPDLPDDDPNAPMPTPHHNPHGKKLPPPAKVLTPDEKEADDLQVAGFYQNDGNYKAAYERARDAVGLQADDPDAHLALADAARKLGKLDEAESNYKRTLALDPVPKTRKAAEKALKEMSGS